VKDPNVLLCDEVTSALDPQTTIAILNLLEYIRYHLGVTILLITHDMQVIKQICDRVAVLESGTLIEESTVSQFFSGAQTDTGKRFVASSIRQDLPKEIMALMQAEPTSENAPVIRLWFHEESTSQPIIAGTCQRFGVDINILQANLEYIHHHPVGIMIVKIDGQRENAEGAIKHLKALGIKVESLGYVATHVV
jgi:D-methionine transport system ATP-binding protein